MSPAGLGRAKFDGRAVKFWSVMRCAGPRPIFWKLDGPGRPTSAGPWQALGNTFLDVVRCIILPVYEEGTNY